MTLIKRAICTFEILPSKNIKNVSAIMCGSRKYPYPTTEGISPRIPPPPWIFHICEELMTHPPPLPLRNFHSIRQRPPPPPIPLEKFIFTKKDYQSKERRRLWVCNGFHLISLRRLELEHSKLPTKQPLFTLICKLMIFFFKWREAVSTAIMLTRQTFNHKIKGKRKGG